MRHTLVLSALLSTGLLAVTSISQAANNSLVFCSEGSPAGFGAEHQAVIGGLADGSDGQQAGAQQCG